MNDKERVLYKVVDIVVDCTTMNINGVYTITREDILGKSRKENHVMARSILSLQLTHLGFSTRTIALMLGRTEQGVHKLVKQGYDYVATSQACRVAAAEVVLKCKELLGEG